jgi:hypothetical protein
MTKSRETADDVHRRVWQRLNIEGVEAAAEGLISACRDPKGTAQAKATAGRVIFEVVGLLNQRNNGRDKEAHEMTPEELIDAIRDLERLKRERAKPDADDEPLGVFD